jgi:hypothetical protein
MGRGDGPVSSQPVSAGVNTENGNDHKEIKKNKQTRETPLTIKNVRSGYPKMPEGRKS